MAKWQLKTPVALMIFNRPETTERVFEAIREAKPPILLVVADGPREDRPGEAEKCAATRAIIDRVDWKCEVLKNYSDVNMGCDNRIPDGLNWVFSIVEQAIILEDDCLPHPTFFRYCEELLERYRDDERVMNISGQNVQFGQSRTKYSYFFSRYTLCWGWASWRRAWQHYDGELKVWPEVRDVDLLKNILADPYAVKVWKRTIQLAYDGFLPAWDFRWMFTCWVQNGLSVAPDVNLVSNIGHGMDATHTVDTSSPYSNMTVSAVESPLKHPPLVVRNLAADRFTQRTIFDYDANLFKRVERKLKKFAGLAIAFLSKLFQKPPTLDNKSMQGVKTC